MAITLKDIVKKTGFSISTVSHVLNGRPGFSPDTQQRIQQAARELGYLPNHLSRALAGGKSMSIGLMGETLKTPIRLLRMRQIETLARADQYHIYLVANEGMLSEPDLLKTVDDLLARRVDGLIICDPPSFGRSSNGVFRIEKDLPLLLRQVDCALERNGLVFLSNNYEGWDQKTFAQRVRETLPPERYRRVELPDADVDVQPAAFAAPGAAVPLARSGGREAQAEGGCDASAFARRATKEAARACSTALRSCSLVSCAAMLPGSLCLLVPPAEARTRQPLYELAAARRPA